MPEHFIQEVNCEHNGKVVMTAYWSGAISKNPYMACSFKGGADGETVKITWVDNKGGTESAEAKIKGKK